MEQTDGQGIPVSQPGVPQPQVEGIPGQPLIFTGQQLLQQALAQHQAMRLAEGQQPLAEAQPVVKPEQTPEQQYQDVFHRLWKGLQAKVEDYHRTMTFKTGELLPPDYWGAPPQVLVITVSPFGKIYQHTSEAFKGDEHLKTMAQGLAKVLQSYQSQALTSSKVAAQAGVPVALQSISKGKQRKKSDFSRQQALFGEFFRNKLMPKALAALAAKIRQVSENTTDDKKKELSNQLEEDGFLLHKDKGCEYGCNFCREFRRVTSWPDGIPLLKNPAAYQKAVLYQLCHHYNLRLEDLPEATENKEDASKDDKQQRMTPGLEALLGVAEAHAKDNPNAEQSGQGEAAAAPPAGQPLANAVEGAAAVAQPLSDAQRGKEALPAAAAAQPDFRPAPQGLASLPLSQGLAGLPNPQGLSSLFAQFRAAAVPGKPGFPGMLPADAPLQASLPFFSGLLQQAAVPMAYQQGLGAPMPLPQQAIAPGQAEEVARLMQAAQTSQETAPSQTDTAPSEDLGTVRSREEEAEDTQGSPKRAKVEEEPQEVPVADTA